MPFGKTTRGLLLATTLGLAAAPAMAASGISSDGSAYWTTSSAQTNLACTDTTTSSCNNVTGSPYYNSSGYIESNNNTITSTDAQGNTLTFASPTGVAFYHNENGSPFGQNVFVEPNSGPGMNYPTNPQITSFGGNTLTAMSTGASVASAAVTLAASQRYFTDIVNADQGSTIDFYRAGSLILSLNPYDIGNRYNATQFGGNTSSLAAATYLNVDFGTSGYTGFTITSGTDTAAMKAKNVYANTIHVDATKFYYVTNAQFFTQASGLDGYSFNSTTGTFALNDSTGVDEPALAALAALAAMAASGLGRTKTLGRFGNHRTA